MPNDPSGQDQLMRGLQAFFAAMHDPSPPPCIDGDYRSLINDSTIISGCVPRSCSYISHACQMPLCPVNDKGESSMFNGSDDDSQGGTDLRVLQCFTESFIEMFKRGQFESFGSYCDSVPSEPESSRFSLDASAHSEQLDTIAGVAFPFITIIAVCFCFIYACHRFRKAGAERNELPPPELLPNLFGQPTDLTGNPVITGSC